MLPQWLSKGGGGGARAVECPHLSAACGVLGAGAGEDVLHAARGRRSAGEGGGHQDRVERRCGAGDWPLLSVSVWGGGDKGARGACLGTIQGVHMSKQR